MYCDLHLLRPATRRASGQRKSGTIQHHIGAPNFRESIVINTVPNFSGESNSHFTLKNSNAHFMVNILHIYCHSALVASLSMGFGPKSTCPQEFWAVTTNCGFCNIPIIEEPVVFDTSRLREVSLHELSICQATKHYCTVLDDSIKEFLIDPLIPLNVPLVIDTSATFGILQRMLDITWFSRKKIKDMHGNVTLTDEGHSTLVKLMPKTQSRDIGLTEIKGCDLENVFDYLCVLVIHICSECVGNLNNEDVRMWLLLTPPNELPWYGIVKQFFLAGRLPPLVRLVAHTTDVPCPPCYSYPQSATVYIGVAIWSSAYCHFTQPKLTILSYYRESELRNHLEIFITAKYWRSVIGDLMEIKIPVIDLKYDDMEKSKLSIEDKQVVGFIACCLLAFFMEDGRYLIERVSLCQTDEYVLWSETDFDVEVCVTDHVEKQTERYQSILYSRFRQVCKARKWKIKEIANRGNDKA